MEGPAGGATPWLGHRGGDPAGRFGRAGRDQNCRHCGQCRLDRRTGVGADLVGPTLMTSGRPARSPSRPFGMPGRSCGLWPSDDATANEQIVAERRWSGDWRPIGGPRFPGFPGGLGARWAAVQARDRIDTGLIRTWTRAFDAGEAHRWTAHRRVRNRGLEFGAVQPDPPTDREAPGRVRVRRQSRGSVGFRPRSRKPMPTNSRSGSNRRR